MACGGKACWRLRRDDLRCAAVGMQCRMRGEESEQGRSLAWKGICLVVYLCLLREARLEVVAGVPCMVIVAGVLLGLAGKTTA